MPLALPLTPHQMSQILLIRHLFARAQQEVLHPLPAKALALLSLHDAVELFVALACESSGRTLKNHVDFAGYWRELKGGPSPIFLSHESSMMRLNTARVALKHKGLTLAAHEIEQFVQSVSDFFLDNTPALWGARLEEMSLIGFIEDEDIRERLERCHEMLSRDAECMGDISIAFHQLIGIAHRKETGDRRSIWPLSMRDIGTITRGVHDFLSALEDAVAELRYDVAILSYPLDARRLRRFREKSYRVVETWGKPRFHIYPPPDRIATLADCRDCLDFVVDSAIRIQNYYSS